MYIYTYIDIDIDIYTGMYDFEINEKDLNSDLTINGNELNREDLPIVSRGFQTW